VLLAFSALGLSACGGGGGGGDGEGGPEKSAETGVRILHAALDLGPVDVLELPIENSLGSVRFGEGPYHRKTNTGDLTIQIVARGAPEAFLASVPLTIAKKDHKSVLIYGDRENLGLNTTVLDDATPDIPDDTSSLRLIHGLKGAFQVELTMSNNGRVPLGASFGRSSRRATIASGPVEGVITRVIDGSPVDAVSFSAEPGKHYSVLITGEADLYTSTTVMED
jgi:hypothetical protein